jgi:hypothetical protein
MVRRVIGFVVGSAAVAASLSGCKFPYVAAEPEMHFTNDSGQGVVVIVEGLSDEYPRVVASRSSYPYRLSECMGTGIRVETKGGDLLGRVGEQACPDWTLTINEDGSLDYVKD